MKDRYRVMCRGRLMCMFDQEHLAHDFVRQCKDFGFKVSLFERQLVGLKINDVYTEVK